MSDHVKPATPATDFLQRWEHTPSLNALRELISVAEQVPAAIARRAGLSATEMAALRMLMRATCSPGELAASLGVTTAASSGIIDRLQAREMVSRQPHEQDKRRMHVVITDQGREAVLRQLLPMYSALQELDASITPSQRETIAAYLQASAAAMRALV